MGPVTLPIRARKQELKPALLHFRSRKRRLPAWVFQCPESDVYALDASHHSRSQMSEHLDNLGVVELPLIEEWPQAVWLVSRHAGGPARLILWRICWATILLHSYQGELRS